MSAETIAPISPTVIDFDSDEAPDTGVRRHHWTRTELYRALELGFFPPELRMELIEGELIDKMPQKRPHAKTISKSAKALELAFGPEYHVLQQSPLLINEENEPEPDIMVVMGTPDDYDDHPTSADVKLVAEVSDTTVQYDRNAKAAVYARAGIADYWILALKNRTLEVRRDPAPLPDSPTGYDYRTRVIYAEADSVAPLHAPNSLIRVADLLPLPKTKS